MSGTAPSVDSIRTTHGVIALSHLTAQIDGYERRAASGEETSVAWSKLIDLVTLRAQILGRIADYEQASVLAERLAEAFSEDGLAFLTRARTRASLHRFAEAMQDLERAVQLGLSGREVDAEKAAILQAVGRYTDAMTIRQGIADVFPNFDGAAGLASLHADLGETDAAEHWFDESYRRYRSVSPFELAQLEFQRGHMWMARDLERALHWFLTAWRRLPFYARAEGHLAEVEFALGHRAAAISRLKRLAADADDPDYAAELAGILREIGRIDESNEWQARAEVRYEELIARHPAAFADHGAHFWLSMGNNPGKALDLARLNLEIRDTPKARQLFSTALAACPSDSLVGGATVRPIASVNELGDAT